ncbi:hypothetical protein [Radiobacillus deserti]|uniref:Uncharacterized protein n=1 Tax=Radiobacillus deserti TaxID=2594883 RepID=A0A516KCG3_9BACI|nr:hypothetical protein [Radiobacillus deserti]QDP39094.1 hypothetical protein FN924_02045 [Radiobacillus deserti]
MKYEIVNSRLEHVRPLDEEIVVEEIEQVIRKYHLILSSKTTLLSKKGSYHWHIKKEGEKGVLEITYWPMQSRLWLEIARNRRADWNVSMIEAVAKEMAHTFHGHAQLLTE